MSNSQDNQNVAYQSDTESEVDSTPQNQQTMQTARRQPKPAQQNGQQLSTPREERHTGNVGGRNGAIRESRIKDRPEKAVDNSLKIKIELDLEVEVDLYARVKGDVTIGLM